MTSNEPNISVVIPVCNARETVGKCLTSLKAQDRDDFEVIIVDDGSTDGTAEVCESYPDVRVFRLNQGGPSRARNRGVAMSRGALVAFTDGDCVVEPNWLTELEKGFTSPEVAGVGGDQKSPADETETGRLIQDFLKTIGFMTDYIKTDETMKETYHNPSCNSMHRKSVLVEVGGFDERLWPGEDVDMDVRIRRRGYKLVYNPDACVGHYRARNYRGFARMMKRYGASAWQLVKRYGFFRPVHFVPVALFVALAALVSILSWKPYLWPIIFLPGPLLFGWFFVRTKDVAKSLKFIWLMAITLVCWNWGFVQGESAVVRSRTSGPRATTR